MAQKAKARDMSEKDRLAEQHRSMRQRVESKEQVFKQRRAAAVNELRQDQTNLKNRADTLHKEQEFRQRRSRSSSSPRPKRGRSRDGPSP